MELKPKMDIDSWCFFCKNGQLTTLMTKTHVSLSEHGPFTLKELLFHWANEVLNHPICGVFPPNLQPNWRIRDSRAFHLSLFDFTTMNSPVFPQRIARLRTLALTAILRQSHAIIWRDIAHTVRRQGDEAHPAGSVHPLDPPQAD